MTTGKYGRPMHAWLGAALVVGMFAAGCGDDDDDAQQDFGSINLALAATSDMGTADRIELQDPQGTTYTITELWVAIDEIELDLPDGVDCDDVEDQISGRVECDEGELEGEDDEIKVEGKIAVNLLTGETVPDISGLTIPALSYDEIDLEVNNIDDDQDEFPQFIRGETVRMLADFERNNTKQELDARFSFDTEAKYGEGQDEEGLLDALRDGDTLVLRLDVTNWFNDVRITQCLADGDLKSANGRVVVDDDVGGECSDAEGEFETNFEESLLVGITR
ncbi:hypothetical protein FIV42_12935 [Persicimonas caeni]|uniref:DUF4382 domain-containing protein n=1 Tax=Persicimonas caeni TaxID=2292766 RepID=A0A4Y6PU18_PERCE|nr:hypothetical protein [Persicimonas caeni]QDG51619.1 hypothetical protein FIV42_12935 [Persicimonas caeni]QED32840.1 hypothetical protein FRD00_12930 [Persicimonas caeni]